MSGGETCRVCCWERAQLRASPALPSLCPGLGHPRAGPVAPGRRWAGFSGAGAGAAGEESGAGVWRALPSCRAQVLPFRGTAGRSTVPLGSQQGSSEVLSLCPSDTEFREALPCRVALSCGRRVLGPRARGGWRERPRLDGLFQWTLFSLRRDWRPPGPRPCSLRQRPAGGSLEQPGVSGSPLGCDCGSEVRRLGVRGAWRPLSWNSHQVEPLWPAPSLQEPASSWGSSAPPGPPGLAEVSRVPCSCVPWFALFLWVPW